MDCRPMRASIDISPTSINAHRRDQRIDRIQICRWKTNPAASSCTVGDHPANSIRLSQHRYGRINIAGLNQPPHATAGNQFAFIFSRYHDLQPNISRVTEFPQPVGITFTISAKEKVRAFDHRLGTERIDHDLLIKILIAQTQQFFIGRIGHHGIDTKLGQQISFAISPGQRRRSFFGT